MKSKEEERAYQQRYQLQYQPQYYAEHREKKLEEARLYYASHREAVLNRQKATASDPPHRKKKKEYDVAHRMLCHDKLLEQEAAYYDLHCNEILQRGRASRRLHPEQTKANYLRHGAKRRNLGFTPLNSPFTGSEGHHINLNDVIYIPKELHTSISHNVWTGRGMEQINVLALGWLDKSSV